MLDDGRSTDSEPDPAYTPSMGILGTGLARVRAWLARESAEARDLGRDTRNRLETALARREAELNAAPADKLDMLQQEIADSGSAFDELRDKIEGRAARADAVEEVTEHDPARPEEPDDPTAP